MKTFNRIAVGTLLFISLVAPPSRADDKVSPSSGSGARSGMEMSQPEKKDAGQLQGQSKQLADTRIENERVQAERKASTVPIAEALSAVEQTRIALRLLAENNTAKANAALENAIGKIDLLLSKHPDLALVPVSAEVRMTDLQADQETINKVAKSARDLINLGYIQDARKLLRAFASELDISTANIPMATYPVAIRSAARALSQGNTQVAKTQLLTALDSIVVAEQSIPLPVIRAQALIDEVNQQVAEKKIDKQQANRLLDSANQQLTLAVDLGYGAKKDFSGIQSEIKLAKANIDKDKENRSLVAKIKSELDGFRNRVFKRSTA